MTKCSHDTCKNDAVEGSLYCNRCIKLLTTDCNLCNTYPDIPQITGSSCNYTEKVSWWKIIAIDIFVAAMVAMLYTTFFTIIVGILQITGISGWLGYPEAVTPLNIFYTFGLLFLIMVSVAFLDSYMNPGWLD
jgi:hypothetical protein